MQSLPNVAYKNEGILLTAEMMECLLSSQFQDLTIVSVTTKHTNGGRLVVSVSNKISQSEIIELKIFMLEQNNIIINIIIQRKTKTTMRNINTHLAHTDKTYEFSKQDLAF